MDDMLALIQANWPLAAAAIVLLLAALCWLLRRGKSAPERHFEPDVLDEGVAPAARNQALIDATPAALVPPLVVVPTVAEEPAAVAEPVVAAPQPIEVAEAEPKPAPQPEPALPSAPAPAPEPALPAPSNAADDLARIKGLGPKLQALLPQLGLSTFAQIAALSAADLTELDGKLGAFAGRPARDGWVEQAKFLAAGDVAGFEARFGKV